MAVLTTDEAENLAGTLVTDISALQEALNRMLTTGDQLASPGVWEGQAATRFKEEWEETRTWGNNSVDRLNELQQRVARINMNITEAGGGR